MLSDHFYVIKTLVTKQPIFLLSEMGAVPIPDDMKFHIVVVKWERSLKACNIAVPSTTLFYGDT